MPRPIGSVSPPIVVTSGTIGSGGGGGSGGGVPPGTIYSMPLEGSESGQNTVQGVMATPGWVVIGGFKYVEDSHVAIAPATLERLFSTTVLASTAALQVRVKLIRADTLVDVAGSLLTFAPPVNVVEATQETADLSAVLVDGIEYQVQAECTGGNLPSDFATVRSAVVRAAFVY